MTNSTPKPIRAICLMGPTAAGKTELAIELSQEFPVELVSVDSVQVYRGMDIGAAKPSRKILDAHPHRLINIRDPWQTYSAGQFCRDVVVAMSEIVEAGRIPLLTGGTMLYFQALQRGLAELPEADPVLRAQLNKRALSEGWPALHAELHTFDPVTAERIKPNDAQRIQRALEVCLSANESMSELVAATAPPVEASYLNIALLPSDRQLLHERIACRLEQMFAEGLVDEVQALLALSGVSLETPAMRAVGYRQIGLYLTGKLSLEDAQLKAVIATRRLAKRQLTWLRSWPDLHVLDCFSPDRLVTVRKILHSWLDDRATS
ncbi:MAG: tRNA (adenosine(37)-N6)-dimethylallyltransferase MiaA [Gammaproteobacteria bacterium]|nr:tRNA (adenosine(37)-N6)-dimethylallyltransferase MiaA [Gammaproteobacteria bacterium]MCP4091114.1 tRNA (adenosine(37)-N6)-dimethylallyltransferase MiaA [Gammaproteobacteria bacterium]MCP4277360.1 tRNA (adenosine(37)-N6)-dimethylallyltransferase MiaA [Gammaproteobacteria bacterium]MCP4831579.1 tRNA (adenosine(37)-N6)-dimethylallyltransferase MiaA [Gammaproteobacteria bacterium]MCP4927802.1 tRNA (adenosine(37)-N6)-dimethylallyltransferase MiaA [Gammaproteobacteria bacterium]